MTAVDSGAVLPAPYLREDLADFAGYSSARTSGPAPGGAGDWAWLNASPEERADAQRALQALPRDASPTRLRNRDAIDGRPRSASVLAVEDCLLATLTPSAFTALSSSNTVWVIRGERPRLGSSTTSTLGRPIKARPTATICCSPPDSVPASCPARSARRGNSE